MTDGPHFLTVNHVRRWMARTIAAFGGDATVRDHGLLDSAVMMPAARFQGRFLHQNVPAMAAAYLFHLGKSRPFLDGNERMALASAEVFVLLNNRRLTATDGQLEELTRAVAAGRVSKKELIAFFRRHVV